MKWVIEVAVRDMNGHRMHSYFANEGEAYSYFCKMIERDNHDEILLVLYHGTCIYSGLQDGEIDWEDLVGFFG